MLFFRERTIVNYLQFMRMILACFESFAFILIIVVFILACCLHTVVPFLSITCMAFLIIPVLTPANPYSRQKTILI